MVCKTAIDIGLLNGEFWPGGRAAWELAGWMHAGDLTSHPACCAAPLCTRCVRQMFLVLEQCKVGLKHG